MDKEQMTYAITLEWLYNVINGNHETAHQIICKMAGKSPDIIHDIFACSSIIISNFAGILKTQSKENDVYINKFCQDMISEDTPEEVFEQFMSEENYNDPDDFKRPPEYTGVPYNRDFTEEDLHRAIDKVNRSLDKLGRGVPRLQASPSGDPSKSKQYVDNERQPIKLKFVGVEFDYDKVNLGEKKVNIALENGFEIIKTINTESGLVIVMGLYKNRGVK